MESYTQQAERLFNIVLTSEQVEQFSIFEKLLLEWNQKINLTAIRDVQGIHTKHFLDSLSAVKGVQWECSRLPDRYRNRCWIPRNTA